MVPCARCSRASLLRQRRALTQFFAGEAPGGGGESSPRG
jgi:hypothetical protein